MKKVLCFAIVLALMISVSAIPVFAYDYYIESPDGETITLDLEKSDTIENVKAKLQDETGIPPHEQRLFYNEQELEDNRTLGDYGIEKNSTIQLKLVTPANSKGVEITAEITAADFGYTMVIPTSTTLTEAKHENVLLGTTAAADGNGIVTVKDIKHPTDKVNVYYTVDLTKGDLTDGTNTIAATYKYKQGEGEFAAIDGTTKVTVYENATVKDSLVNVTADDTQWKAAPTGTYNATVVFNFAQEDAVQMLTVTFNTTGNGMVVDENRAQVTSIKVPSGTTYSIEMGFQITIGSNIYKLSAGDGSSYIALDDASGTITEDTEFAIVFH